MRTRFPDGSRTAKSRVPHGWSVGGARVAHPREGRIEVVGLEVDAVQGALGHEGGDCVAVGGAAVQIVREDDGDAGLGGGADGDPAEVLAGDIVAQLKAERVAVEGQGGVGVMDDDEARGKREIHVRKARARGPRAPLRRGAGG